MGLFSAIGNIVDKVTDVAGAVAPVVSAFNPALGAAFSAADALDESLNPQSQQEGAQFESALEQASLILATDQLAINQEQEADGEEYIEEAVNGA